MTWDGDGINWADADCHYGDHHWDGGVCSNCGKQFRCGCGRFLNVDDIDKHLNESCPQTRHLVGAGSFQDTRPDA